MPDAIHQAVLTPRLLKQGSKTFHEDREIIGVDMLRRPISQNLFRFVTQDVFYRIAGVQDFCISAYQLYGISAMLNEGAKSLITLFACLPAFSRRLLVVYRQLVRPPAASR